MSKDPWLPKGYSLPDDSRLRVLRFSGEKWQIYDTQPSGNVLVVFPGLGDKWIKAGLIDESLFTSIRFGDVSYSILISDKKYALEPVDCGRILDEKIDAIAFAVALSETRKIYVEGSLHDAIYVEQYSRLLPTWTLTPEVDDQVVLGSWISGGVAVSAESFRRLSNLVGWMSPSDLADIITAAGFEVPGNYRLMTRPKSVPESTSPDENAIPRADVQLENIHQPADTSKHRKFVLPGRPQLEEFFNEHVVDIIFNPEKYQPMGIGFPSAIVLHGPPGCGKTFAVERLVEFIDWPSYTIDSSSVGSPYIHETSKKISEVFDKAMDSAPSVITIDEMEAFLSDRQSGGHSGLHHIEEVSEFLRRIPEAVNNRVLIIAMTNLIDLIDPAILRRGRFDHIIEVGMPSREEVKSLLNALLGKLPVSEDMDMGSLLDRLTDKPLSDAAFVVREAARLAAKVGKTEIDQDSLTKSLYGLPKEIGRAHV